MHILVASLYAGVLWLALVAFLQYAGGPALDVLLCGPLVLSAIIVALYALELLFALARICASRVADEIRGLRSSIRAR